MPLPSLTVVGTLQDILGDIDMDDELVVSAMTRAVIEFKSNISPNVYVKWDGTLNRIYPVFGRVDTNGNIVNNDGDPIKLLAQDDGLNVRGIQWRVIVHLPESAIPPIPSGQMRPFWFYATADNTTVDLFDVVPEVARGIDGTGVEEAAVGALNAMLEDPDSVLRLLLADLFGGLSESAIIALISDTDSDLRALLDALYGGDGLEILEDGTTGLFFLDGSLIEDGTDAGLFGVGGLTEDGTDIGLFLTTGTGGGGGGSGFTLTEDGTTGFFVIGS